jgi:hypothetical protein
VSGGAFPSGATTTAAGSKRDRPRTERAEEIASGASHRVSTTSRGRRFQFRTGPLCPWTHWVVSLSIPPGGTKKILGHGGGRW